MTSVGRPAGEKYGSLADVCIFRDRRPLNLLSVGRWFSTAARFQVGPAPIDELAKSAKIRIRVGAPLPLSGDLFTSRSDTAPQDGRSRRV